MRQKLPVEIGQRFTRTGSQHRMVWTVARVFEAIDGIEHVRLAKDGRVNDTITVSAMALTDRAHFLPEV